MRVVTLKGPITNPIKTKINIVAKIVTKVNMKSKLIKIGYCSDVLNRGVLSDLKPRGAAE